ncbi:MAG: enoyl-CoA hydratase/isomerase family protein [Promethearchaeota archaeon]
MKEKTELIIENDIAIIKLVDPENLNALGKDMARELLQHLHELENKSEIRALLITGTGKAFSAGGNIKEFKEGIEQGKPGKVMDELLQDLYKIAKNLRVYPKPVIAAVNGWAVGAGMNLALSCDFIIASENARFRQSFSKLALIPGFAGTILLSRQLTWQQAVEMAFFGETYSAQDMKELGFINYIVPEDKLEESALEWAKKFAEGPTLTYARTKRLFFDALSSPLEEHLEEERQIQIKSAESEDFKIGVFAIIEKKPPKFIGK